MQKELFIKKIFEKEEITSDEVTVIGNQFEIVTFKPQEIIFRQGEPAKGLYILMAGNASVNVSLPGSLPTKISTLTDNSFIGEVSLIEQSSATATVRAELETCCLFLPAKSFTALSIIYPHIIDKILSKIIIILNEKIHNNIELINQLGIEIPGFHINESLTVIKQSASISNELLDSEEIPLTLIKKLKCFNKFNDDEIFFLMNKMQYLYLPKKFIFAKINNYYFYAYFIVQGGVQVLINDEAGANQLMIVPPGDLIDFNSIEYNNYITIHQVYEDVKLLCLSEDGIKELKSLAPFIYYRYRMLSVASLTKLFKASNQKLAQLTCAKTKTILKPVAKS